VVHEFALERAQPRESVCPIACSGVRTSLSNHRFDPPGAYHSGPFPDSGRGRGLEGEADATEHSWRVGFSLRQDRVSQCETDVDVEPPSSAVSDRG